MCLLSVVLHFDYSLPLLLCVLQHIPDPNTEPVLYCPSSPDGRVQPHVYWHVGHIMRNFSLNQATGWLMIKIYFLLEKCLLYETFSHGKASACVKIVVRQLPAPCLQWCTFDKAYVNLINWSSLLRIAHLQLHNTIKAMKLYVSNNLLNIELTCHIWNCLDICTLFLSMYR